MIALLFLLPTLLIVLISDDMANNSNLAHKIYWMAEHDNMAVLYLVLVEGKEESITISRSMATMKAVTSANRLFVEVQQTDKTLWLETLHQTICPGDIIICLEEHTIGNGMLKSIPVREFLASHLDTPVRSISGFYQLNFNRQRTWLCEASTLLGYLVIIALFTWLEIRLDQALDGPLARLLIMTTFCFEMGAFWAWYKFDSRLV